MQSWRISKGWDVYGLNDEKLGTVHEVYENNYFQMDTGFLGLGKDFWIPFSAITDVRGDKVYIRADKNNLKSMGWDKKPTGLGGGISGTGPSSGDRY